MKPIIKSLTILVVLTLLLTPVFAVDVVTNASTDILTSDIPIMYGDELFRSRVAERTGGERSPIGLVLSGGSARAFAHIGVLKMLEEEGIEPDFIISNSMGSIIGLLYAAGMSADQIYDSISSVSLETLFDLTIPLEGGIMKPARFNALLASILGPGLQVEDLPIPIIVISEDLVTKRQVYLAEGNFYTVMQAAYALPVYFPPVEFRGHLLLDGGITNLAPVNLAYEYADTVIVSTTFYDVETLNLRNPLTILNVSLDIGKRRKGVEELKEHLSEIIWIRCSVEDVSFMEFSAIEELRDKGYASAQLQKEALSTLPKSVVSDELLAYRETLSHNISTKLSQHMMYSHSKLHVGNHVLGLGLDVERNKSDDTLLKDANLFGLRYGYGKGDLKLSLNAGMAFQTFTNSSMAVAPALRGQLDYYFLNLFKLSLDSSLILDEGFVNPLFTSGLTLEGRLFFFKKALRLRVLESFEHISNPATADLIPFWGGNKFLFGSTVEAQLKLPKQRGLSWEEGTLSLSYQLLGDYQLSRPFIASSVDSLLLHKPTGLFADISMTARFALDGQGDVPLFMADGFRTNNAALRSQGHDLSLGTTNTANYLVINSLSLGYTALNFKPALGELILFEKSSIALYLDLLWHAQDVWPPSLSLGLELYTEISLLGIRTLPFTIYGGWDQSVQGIVWGFCFSVLL